MTNVRDFPADRKGGDRIAVKTGLGLGEFELVSPEEYVATIPPEKLPKAGIIEERVREIVREIVREMVCRFAIRNSPEEPTWKELAVLLQTPEAQAVLERLGLVSKGEDNGEA